MRLTRTALATAVATAVAGAAIGLGAGTAAAAEWPAWSPDSGPRKPAETWLGQPVVWWDGSPSPGGHWGVWLDGNFMNLT